MGLNVLVSKCLLEFENGVKDDGIEEGLRRFFKTFGELLGECCVELLKLNKYLINLILN